jgi:hypothetical protein
MDWAILSCSPLSFKHTSLKSGCKLTSTFTTTMLVKDGDRGILRNIRSFFNLHEIFFPTPSRWQETLQIKGKHTLLYELQYVPVCNTSPSYPVSPAEEQSPLENNPELCQFRGWVPSWTRNKACV